MRGVPLSMAMIRVASSRVITSGSRWPRLAANDSRTPIGLARSRCLGSSAAGDLKADRSVHRGNSATPTSYGNAGTVASATGTLYGSHQISTKAYATPVGSWKE